MNLFELLVKIGVDDKASKNIENITKKLGKGLKTAAKVGTKAVGAAAAGLTALTTAAVKNYAEYEQLVGGVDTLFKKSSQKVQQYAADAYKTAGMSANDYMENATAFSATLINALGGDTEKAAEYANRAMISMSDNANKMGNSIDTVVQTYQSLSRGNFAMLDSLKLGYGGTKTELQRLIKDASTYNEIQKEMGITVDATSMSFDNIVNAIAVVQGKLGVAGATALEAGTTIEGSVNSMKAAWDNLITGITNKNADLETLIGNLVTTIVGDGTEGNLGVLGNILPAVKQALSGASSLVSQMLPIIVEEIPMIITENLPILAKAAISIVKSLVDGISSNQELLMTTALEVITYLAESLITMLPQIIELGLDLILSLATGLSESLPELIPAIFLVVDKIVKVLTDKESLNQILSSALEIILALAEGIGEYLPQLIDSVFLIIDAITSMLYAPENLAKLVNAALRIVIAIAGGLIAASPRMLKGVVQLITSVIDGFKNADWKQVGKDTVNGLLNGLKNAWTDVKNWFKASFNGILSDVKGWFGIKSPSRKFAEIGKFIDLGLLKGLEDFSYLPIKAMEELSDGVFDAFDDGYDMEYAIDTASAPYEGETFTQSLANAMNALIAVEEDRKIEVEVSVNGSDTETGRMLLNLINVTAKEVYA